MAEGQRSDEDNFRDTLKDVDFMIQKLAPFCGSFEEMLGMIRLSFSNDAQLKLLMATVKAQQSNKGR